MDRRIVEELIKTRRAVREKLKSLKSDMVQSQSDLEKSYKPLTDPIKELLSNIKTEIKKEPEDEYIPKKSDSVISSSSTPKKQQRPIDQYLPTLLPSFLEGNMTFETGNFDDDSTHNSSTEIDREVERSRQFINDFSSPSYIDYLSDFHELPRAFIDASVRDTDDLFDHHHGVVHDMLTNKFKIGDSELLIVGKDVQVKEIKYPGTVGLYELLFKKSPHGYNNKDLDNYMDILKRTHAYRKNYKADAQIHGTSSNKYLTIIKPYLVKKGILKAETYSSRGPFSKPPPPQTRLRSIRPRTGIGMVLSNNPIDYVYYDDPNELVDRLRILIASQEAGNNGHSNEIGSILEELREGGFIE